MQANYAHRPTIRPLELTLLLTCMVAACYAFGIYLFSSLLPEMRLALSLGYAQIGWMTGVAQLGFLAGSLLSAGLVRRWGAVRLMLASVLLCCLSLALMARVGAAWQIGVLLALAAGAAATVWVPMVAVVQTHIAAQHHGKVLGLVSSGTAYGLFLNGVCVPALLAWSGWQSVWLFSAGLTLAVLLWGGLRLNTSADAATAALTGQTEVAQQASPSAPEIGVGVGLPHLLRDRLVQQVLALMLLNGMACMPTMNYLLPFLREERGYDAVAAGWVASTLGLLGMVGGFAMGALADRITVTRALVLTYLLLALSALLFLHPLGMAMGHGVGLGVGPGVVLAGAMLFGLAFNALFGLVPALVSQRFAVFEASQVFAFSNVALGLGSMLGNLAGGLLRQRLQSFVPVFWVILLLELLLLALSLYTHRLLQPAPHAGRHWRARGEE